MVIAFSAITFSCSSTEEFQFKGSFIYTEPKEVEVGMLVINNYSKATWYKVNCRVGNEFVKLDSITPELPGFGYILEKKPAGVDSVYYSFYVGGQKIEGVEKLNID